MRIITTVIAVILLSVSLLTIKPIQEKAGEVFWSWFAYQMDKEEAKRKEQEKRYEVIRGRDTAFIWNKHYEIWDHLGEKHFGIEIDDANDNILRAVSLYEVHNDKFYVVSVNGYAIADRSNCCRVFLLSDTDEVESKYIKYLTSYEEFSEEEQKHFSKMIKKQKVYLYK